MQDSSSSTPRDRSDGRARVRARARPPPAPALRRPTPPASATGQDLGLHRADPEGHDRRPATWSGRLTARPRRSTRSRRSTTPRTRRPAAVRLAPAAGARHDHRPGLATSPTPSPTEFDFTINADANFWDGTPVTAAGRRVQPQAGSRPEGRRLLRRDLRPGEVLSTSPATRPSRSLLTQPDYWLLGELSATPGRGRAEEVRRGQGQGLRHGRRRHHVLRPVQARLLEDRPGRQDGPEPRTTGTPPCPSRR